MPVITLSREIGSGGDEVAVAVAERLGLRLVGREMINQAAREAGAPEVALAEIDELGLLGVRPKPAAVRLYREITERLIREVAAEGNLLLVGRGGQMVLAGARGVLHVRVGAPREQRLGRIKVCCQSTQAAAAAMLEASDRARAGYLRRHYHVDWTDGRLYDLVLNMGQLPVAAAVNILCAAAQHIGPPEPEVAT